MSESQFAGDNPATVTTTASGTPEDQAAPSDSSGDVSPATASREEPKSSNPIEDFKSGNRGRIGRAMTDRVTDLLTIHPECQRYCLVAIFDPHTSIGQYELDRIHSALTTRNGARDRDVLLLLLSTGGSIEPAYQISKLCKAYAAHNFHVCVPRFAKSAATLISLGADQIHMGELGHLGPIDPQFGGLPALGIARALDTLAELVEKHPKAADMLALYLKDKLPVQQIGYYERVAESAVQYAQRLLEKKARSTLARDPEELAHELVHAYKDHGFVIDVAEATGLLGSGWVTTNTPESRFAEAFYTAFESADFFVQFGSKKRLSLIGSLDPRDVELSVYLSTRK